MAKKKSRKKGKRKSGKRKGKGKKKAWCVKSGKSTVSKHRKKSTANKVKKQRHKAGKKARIVSC